MTVPIIAMQRKHTETGRIRLGVKVIPAKGKPYPSKLETLRFTSPRRSQIDVIAKLYGGEVRQWTPDRGADQWEVISKVTEVPVMIPQQDITLWQFYELWTRGGLVRRCDGVTEQKTDTPCMCDPNPQLRECKLHTRLRLLLADVPGIGEWIIDTGSFYAALELPGVAELLQLAGGYIDGRLVLDTRTRTVAGKTKKFVVPVLDVAGVTPRQLVNGEAAAIAAQRRSEAMNAAPAAAAITAGPGWELMIRTAPTKAALRSLYGQIEQADGEVSEELTALFAERSAAFDAPAQEPPGDVEEPPEDDVIDAEIVTAEYTPGPPIGADEWPDPRQPGSGAAR